MAHATFERELLPEARDGDSYGRANLYRLSSPLSFEGDDYGYVCVSTISFFGLDETLVFPVEDRDASYGGYPDHVEAFTEPVTDAEALEAIGYPLTD